MSHGLHNVFLSHACQSNNTSVKAARSVNQGLVLFHSNPKLQRSELQPIIINFFCFLCFFYIIIEFFSPPSCCQFNDSFHVKYHNRCFTACINIRMRLNRSSVYQRLAFSPGPESPFVQSYNKRWRGRIGVPKGKHSHSKSR